MKNHKSHLFIKNDNTNSFKRKFAYRKLFLQLTLMFVVGAFLTVSAIETGHVKGFGAFAATTALIVMPTGLIKDKETATHNSDGTEKTDEEKMKFVFKWESDQAIEKALKIVNEETATKLKELQDKIDKLKPDENLAETIKGLRKDLDDAGAKLKAFEEKPEVDKLINVQTQLKAWMKDNEKAIASIKSGTKADLKPLVIKVASPMTPANTYNGSAYLPNVQMQPGANEIVRVQPTFWDYIRKGFTAAAAYVWVNKKNPLGAAGFIGPGVAKPGISFEIATEVSNAKKIAVSEKCATELLQDIEGMQSWLEMEIAYQLKHKMNTTLMTGVSSSTVPAGIQTISVAFTTSGIEAGANPNNYDALIACVAQLRSGNLVGAVTAFMNPIDFANMKLTKAISQGQPFIAPETGVTWVEDNNVPIGYVQVALLDYYKILIYQDFTVTFGWENDDFTKNLVTAIGEMRIHQFFSENYTGAFIYDTFENIKTAITTPSPGL